MIQRIVRDVHFYYNVQSQRIMKKSKQDIYGKKIYPKRKETKERVFVDVKENHGIRFI